jgi:N utilization substance protein A
VPWIDEPDIFISRALSPATVTRVITDERRHHAQVIVDEEQLSLAIGKAGQNSRLAVQLTGWGLDIITEDEYQRRLRRLEESKVELRRLDGVSELIALSLATSGFISLRGIAESEADMLETVPGLEGQAAQLRAQAIAYVTAAEASGEELRPATIEEVEAEERAADKRRAAESAAEEAKRSAALAAAEVELAAQDAAAAEAKAAAEAAKAEAAVAEDDTEEDDIESGSDVAEEVAGEQISGDEDPSAESADANEETSSTQTQVEEAAATEADDGSDLDAASAASESGNDDGAAGV